jgi:5-methylcytosine-specific restriction endonuclease McrA
MDITLKKRQPKETWQMTRKRVLERNQSTCQHKAENKSLVHLSQLFSRKLEKNKPENLRTLRGRCRLLVKDQKHRRIIVKALKKGTLCPNWPAELYKLVKD